tara:strand:+ start:543 stop:764 length:222 start_codon:yes stop_codon:yes gene_type:complete
MVKSIPKGEIEFLINREHVSVSDSCIEEIIRNRTIGREGWTEAKIKQAVKHAIKTHHENQGLFDYVMKGENNA